MGDRARAASAFDAAIAALGYRNQGDWYQSPRRDLAGVVALAAEAGFDDLVEALTPRMAADLPEPARLTTQEQAFLLLAARSMAGAADALSLEFSGEAMEGRTVRLDADGLAGAGSLFNRGERPVWLTAFARGVPSSAPPAVAQGFAIEKGLYDRRGNTIDPSAIRRGDQIIVSLTVTPQQTRRLPLIIADLLPAGLEIEGVLRPDDAGENGPYPWLGELNTTRISEARDDRFLAAIDIQGRDAVRVAYMVRAVTPGRFTLPGAVAEDMYDPEVFARSEAAEAVIRP